MDFYYSHGFDHNLFSYNISGTASPLVVLECFAKRSVECLGISDEFPCKHIVCKSLNVSESANKRFFKYLGEKYVLQMEDEMAWRNQDTYIS